MSLPPALSEFKLKLIQYRAFQIVVRDGGRIRNFTWGGRIFLLGEGSKEYVVRTKMEQEQWLQIKMLFLLGYNLKVVIWCKCVCVCVCVYVRTMGSELIFGGGGSNFLAGGGGIPSIPSPVGKTLQYQRQK